MKIPSLKFSIVLILQCQTGGRNGEWVSQSLWMEMMYLDIEGSAAAADQSQQVISSQPRRPENRAEEWDADARLRPSAYTQIFVSVCEYLQWTDRDWNSKSRNATMEKVSRVHIFYLRHLKACRTVSLKCKYWTLQRNLSSILGVIRLKYIITIVQIWMTIDYQDDPNKLVNKLCQNDGKSLDHRLKKFGGRTW